VLVVRIVALVAMKLKKEKSVTNQVIIMLKKMKVLKIRMNQKIRISKMKIQMKLQKSGKLMIHFDFD
jgi:hypothetical protein